MKRYFAMVLAVVLLCICTGAVAMGWGRTDNPPPPDYTATEPTPEERIAVLEEALNMLLSGVTE